MNLSTVAAAAAKQHADRTAFIDGRSTYTFERFEAVVDRLASWLAARCSAGDRIAYMLKNGMPAVLLHFAITRAGLVRVPVNARYTALELKNLIEDCGARLVFHDSQLSALVITALAHLSECTAVATDDGDVEWVQALSCDLRADLLHRSALDDLASINYTSGTTGRPKGVMVSHRNWLAVYKNLLIDRDLRSDDIAAHIGPFSHAAGTYMEAWFMRGACNLIIEPTVDGLCQAIEQHRVTGFSCVPTFLTMLVNSHRLADVDCSSLRIISYGAEAISRDTLEKCWLRFGPVLWQNYGQTEAMVTCIHLPPQQHLDAEGHLRHGYIGQPYTFVDVAIRDPATGDPVDLGAIGELTVCAEHVMSGYWNRPEETRKVLRDGWLWTGDLAVRDDSRLVRIVGRSKDMLICGGFNIYPQEIESVLTSTGLISEAAVVARQDALWGEIPVAYVTLNRSRHVDSQELTDLFKPLLGIKTPKQWTVLAELPRSKNGKIDKQALTASAVGGNQ